LLQIHEFWAWDNSHALFRSSVGKIYIF